MSALDAYIADATRGVLRRMAMEVLVVQLGGFMRTTDYPPVARMDEYTDIPLRVEASESTEAMIVRVVERAVVAATERLSSNPAILRVARAYAVEAVMAEARAEAREALK